MALEAILSGLGAAGGLLSGIGGFFGGGQEVQYPITSSKRDPAAARMQAFVNAMLTGETGRSGYKGKEVSMPFALPPALQQAMNSLKSMVNYQTIGGIDEATEMANAQLRGGAQTLAERGVYGGQQVAMEQQIMDQLIREILGQKRQAAETVAQYGAGAWEKSYDTSMDMLKILATGGGGGTPVQGSNLGQNLAQLGKEIGQTAADLSGAFGTPTPQGTGMRYDPNLGWGVGLGPMDPTQSSLMGVNQISRTPWRYGYV